MHAIAPLTNDPEFHVALRSGSLVAAGLILFALRGRRVNRHPICRQCGFDLFGKPKESTVCGECGADLHHGRAIRVGAREKRRGILRIAVPILTCGEKLQSQVNNAVSVQYVQFSRDGVSGKTWQLQGRLRCNNAPINLAYRVIFDLPGTKHEFDADDNVIFIPRGTDTRAAIYTAHYLGPTDYFGRTVDIELNPAPAVSPNGTREVWGKPMLFKGVPVLGKENWTGDSAAASAWNGIQIVGR